MQAFACSSGHLDPNPLTNAKWLTGNSGSNLKQIWIEVGFLLFNETHSQESVFIIIIYYIEFLCHPFPTSSVKGYVQQIRSAFPAK